MLRDGKEVLVSTADIKVNDEVIVHMELLHLVKQW